MVVVLGQRDNVALRGDLEPTAAADFDVGALKLPNQRAISLEDGHVETVSMAVPDEDVASIADVDTVGVVGDVLTANAAQKVAILIKNHHTVTLKHNSTS